MACRAARDKCHIRKPWRRAHCSPIGTIPRPRGPAARNTEDVVLYKRQNMREVPDSRSVIAINKLPSLAKCSTSKHGTKQTLDLFKNASGLWIFLCYFEIWWVDMTFRGYWGLFRSETVYRVTFICFILPWSCILTMMLIINYLLQFCKMHTLLILI